MEDVFPPVFPPHPVNHTFTFQEIGAEEVWYILSTLQVSKSSGMDRISPRMLRLASPAIARSLTSIFNASLESGVVPAEWKQANITAVHKKDVKTEVSNYRPVSILPVVAKVFEKVVHIQLYSYRQQNSFLHPTQSGFRPGHSTQDVLVASIDDWRKSLNDNLLTSVALVDLFKAFDSIDHDLLLRKLQCYRVGGKESKWFSNYLLERKQRMLINGCASAWSEVTRGVPQGPILGPLLFKIFINDLPSAVTSSIVMMYADDTTLYHSCVDVGDLQQALSADLQSLAAWLKWNKLKINVQKTQLLLLGCRSRAQELERVRISLNGTEIRHQDKVKYLGVMIDRQLTWKQHISCIRQRCFQINRLRRSLSWKLRKQLYLSLVLPHLDHCCVAWRECSVELQTA